MDHDRLAEFSSLLDTTVGRDKTGRLIQYFAKLWKWHIDEQLVKYDEKTSSKETKELVAKNADLRKQIASLQANAARLAAIQTHFGTTRKILRLARSLAVLRGISTMVANTKSWDAQAVLDLSARLALAFYFAIDHVSLALRIGVWKTDKDTENKINFLTEGSWVVEIACGLLLSILRFHTAASAVSSPQTILARNAAARGIVRNALDLPLALHFMNLTGNWPGGHFAAAGCITSVISLWEMWPQIAKK